MPFPRFWEPEERVGEIWNDLVREIGSEACFADSEVSFDEMRGPANIIFRALGGPEGVDLLPVATDISANRLTRRARLSHDVDRVTHAQYDGQRLALPPTVSLFEDAALSRGLYRWLAALAAFMRAPAQPPADPLQRDIEMLRESLRAESAVLACCPGLLQLRADLGSALLEVRPAPLLPSPEAELEQAIRALLAQEDGGGAPIAAAIRDPAAAIDAYHADAGYRPFRPVALWPLLSAPRPADTSSPGEDSAAQNAASAQDGEKMLKAIRRKAEQADRKDSFILHRFESILSMIDFLDINRTVDDDEEDNARKATEDLDEASLARNSKSAKTKLKFHLDLAPRDVERSSLLGEWVYPEWDWKSGCYLPNHARVEERLAAEAPTEPLEKPATRRRIAAVQRQFEALRPRRRILRRQPDGLDLDIDEVVRAHCDFLASGETEERIYCAIRNDERDLAVAVLFDLVALNRKHRFRPAGDRRRARGGRRAGRRRRSLRRPNFRPRFFLAQTRTRARRTGQGLRREM
ncbi:hypothetical protein WOA01_00750 [Methylocystis sp. IM2]|uniref:hypothetical protein n=1 Tax=Methylocystis sp. IM2 TaxID=3136563 RepID=UPI0030F5FB47